MAESSGTVIKVIKPKSTKERLVNQLIQKIGGLKSHWNEHPKEELAQILQDIENLASQSAWKRRMEAYADTRQKNQKITARSNGINSRAISFERKYQELLKKVHDLEVKYRQLSKAALEKTSLMVEELLDIEKSEIYHSIKWTAKTIQGMANKV